LVRPGSRVLNIFSNGEGGVKSGRLGYFCVVGGNGSGGVATGNKKKTEERFAKDNRCFSERLRLRQVQVKKSKSEAQEEKIQGQREGLD